MKPKVKPLTEKQKRTLDFINTFAGRSGYSPSLKDIAQFLKTKNLSTAQYFVEELEKKGHLKKVSGKNRGITLINKPPVAMLLGNIAAGKPIEPIENPETIEIPKSIKLDTSHSHYALRVKGDSMMDMGVLDDDIILVRHQITAQDGDVVVAIIKGGATLKVLKRENGKIILEPRNKDYLAIEPKQLEIRGKFCGLIRNSL